MTNESWWYLLYFLGQRRSVGDIKNEPKEEIKDTEEDEEGEDLPDSFGVFVKEESPDPDDPDPAHTDEGIAEFQRTVSFWAKMMILTLLWWSLDDRDRDEDDDLYTIHGSGAVI